MTCLLLNLISKLCDYMFPCKTISDKNYLTAYAKGKAGSRQDRAHMQQELGTLSVNFTIDEQLRHLPAQDRGESRTSRHQDGWMGN
jgi:hypothetical protein